MLDTESEIHRQCSITLRRRRCAFDDASELASRSAETAADNRRRSDAREMTVTKLEDGARTNQWLDPKRIGYIYRRQYLSPPPSPSPVYRRHVPSIVATRLSTRLSSGGTG